MLPTALQIIRDEHLAISAVVFSLRHLARGLRDRDERPDFRLLHAIIDYIVEYPDRWHHPKEDQYLFTALARREPKAKNLLQELEAEHRGGEILIETLRRQLEAYARGEQDAMLAFVDAVEHYAQFQWEHMRKEEDLVLPMARQALTVEDWREVADAFRANDNPLSGVRTKTEVESLYRTILSLVPTPIGPGEP